MRTVLAALLLIAGAGFAQAQSDNAYDDPLAWRRIDLAAPQWSLEVQDLGRGLTRRVSGRPLLLGTQEIYLPSGAVADIFQASRLWQEAAQRLTLRFEGLDATVTAGSRLVTLAGQERLLPVPVLALDGDLWLPLTLITSVLAPRTAQQVDWDPERRLLALGEARPNVIDLHVAADAAATTLRLDLTEPLGYRVLAPEPDLVEIKIYGGRLALDRIEQAAPAGLVHSVRARQDDGHAVVVVRLDERAARTRDATADGGRRIILTVEEDEFGALPDPVPRGHAHIEVDLPVEPEVHERPITAVVIDAGHGGDETGVVGRGGTDEKTVNLAVARQLARYLERRGLTAVLTRDKDVTLSLPERAEIANRHGGDLFVSLHCNGWFESRASGVETYFLSPAKTDWSKSVEQAENQAGEPDDISFIVWELVQNRFISRSSELAELVQRQLCDGLGLTDRGVRQAGFRVLVGAYMPAILVEMGFLSNPEDEVLLTSRDHQERLAAAIGDAILAYRSRVAGAGALTGGRP